MGALPNLLVIGAQKCGTTALHYYLDLHPAIQMSQPKELNFFFGEAVTETRGCVLAPDELAMVSRIESNWHRGTDWYAAHFSSDASVRGEASPNYTAPWHPDAAAKMASVVPDAKIIFLVRDPIERIISHYLTLRAVGREQRSLDDALADMHGMYVSRSRYFTVLEPFLRLYPDSHILVVAQEDLRGSRRETMQAVYRFADVDGAFWSERLERERNPSTDRPRIERLERWLDRMRVRQRLVARIPAGVKWKIERGLLALGGPADRPHLDPNLRREIASSLEDEVQRLRRATGKQFVEWSI